MRETKVTDGQVPPAAAQGRRALPHLRPSRVVLGFILAPIVPIALPLLPAMASASSRETMVQAFVIAAIFVGYLPTLVLGAPAYFLLRKAVRPSVLVCALVGGVVAATPWLVLSVFSPADYAYSNNHITRIHGHLTWDGLVDTLIFCGALAAFGALGGLVFWAIAVRGETRLRRR